MKTCRSCLREVIKELPNRFVTNDVVVPSAIEPFERPGIAEPQNHLSARYPVSVFPVDEVTDDINGRPGARALAAANPGVGQSAKKRIESDGCSGEESDRV